MKQVRQRTALIILLIALLAAGMALFCIFYFVHGADWASFSANAHAYTDGTLTSGEILDRKGVTLYDPATGEYADSRSLRRATLHAVGDPQNNISTGAKTAFRSRLVGFNPLTGTIVNGFQDVPEPVRELLGATGEFSTDAKQGPILAQSWYVLESIRRTVESAGGQMSDVIKLVQYFRNLDHFPYYSRVRKLFYPDQPPVSTVVQVSEMLPDATVLIEVEATVWLPQPIHSEAPR